MYFLAIVTLLYLMILNPPIFTSIGFFTFRLLLPLVLSSAEPWQKEQISPFIYCLLPLCQVNSNKNGDFLVLINPFLSEMSPLDEQNRLALARVKLKSEVRTEES